MTNEHDTEAPRRRRRAPGRKAFAVAGALGVAVLLAACGSTASANGGTGSSSQSTGPGTNVNKVVNGKFQKPILIGGAIALTGLQQVDDAPPMIGLRWAAQDINKAGGIDGQPIKFITSDTTSTVAGARTAALNVLNQGAQILLNTCNYDFGVAGGDVGQAAHVLDWSLCAASPKWGVQGIGLMAFVDSIMTYPEGNVDAQFGVSHFGKNVFLFCDTFIDYTQQTCQGAKDELKALGANIVGQATWNDQTDTSISTQISQIKATANVQWIEMPTIQPNGITAFRAMRAAGINQPIVSTTAVYGLSFLHSIPHMTKLYMDTEASETGDDPRAQVNALNKRYRSVYGQWPDNANFDEGYAMMQVMEQALKAVKTTNGFALANYIQSHCFNTVMGQKCYTPTYHWVVNQPYVIVQYTTPAGQQYPFPQYVTTEYPKGVNWHLGS